MRHPIDVAIHGPARAADGQPLCRGYDWTAPAWTPDSLLERRDVGQSSWIDSGPDNDIAHEMHYYVDPDGSAVVVHCIEDPWGSDDWSASSLTTLDAGTWEIAYFPTWPRDFGSRSGVQILITDSL